jgi:hypothetical protein
MAIVEWPRRSPMTLECAPHSSILGSRDLKDDRDARVISTVTVMTTSGRIVAILITARGWLRR